jgi:succinoglycan biosynthesis transport protein ExoP
MLSLFPKAFFRRRRKNEMTEAKSSRALEDDSDEMVDSSFNWKGYLIALRERLWLILFCLAIGAGVSYYQVQNAVPVYAARCTVSVEPLDHVLRIQAVKSDLADNSWATSVVERMKSPELVDRVNDRLVKESTKDKIYEKQREGLKTGLPWFIISQRPGSSMIDIIAEYTDPVIASLWANGMVTEYQLHRGEEVSKATANANRFLIDEAARIRDKVTASEIALQEYREKKGAASLEKEQDTVVSRFRELSSQFNAAKDKRMGLESDMTNADALGSDTAELEKLTSIVHSPGVMAARSALEDAERQRGELKQRYLYKHPKYQAINATIDGLKVRMSEAVLDAAKSLKNYFSDSLVQEKRLREELDAQEKKTYQLGKLQVDYDKLKREIEADKIIYDQVLTRLKETDLTKGLEELQNSPLRVLQSATPNPVPIRPDKKKTVLVGTFGGLSFGICIVLGLFFLDGSYHTVDEVEKALKRPVLAAVPVRKTIPSQWKGLPLLDTVQTKHGPIAESFRALRTALILLGRDQNRKIVMVTSAVPSEGKSFTAANLAITFAQQNLRTLLIDLDLRKPVIGKMFFESAPEKGVTDVLAEQIHFAEAVRESTVPHLDILACGSRAPNPSELISSGVLPKLLDRLRAEYDRIVIDTAPVIAVSDALLVSPLADTILQVVHANKTARIAVQRADKALTMAAGKPTSGIVLNLLPLKSHNYYHYGDGNRYGDKGVYGSPV